MTLLRNVLLAATTAAKHLGDDPVLLVAQIVRRLPAAFGPAAARVLGSVPTFSTRALGAHLAGDDHSRDQVIDGALAGRIGGRSAARLAEVALTANDVERADSLLARAGAAAATRARRRWHAGDMTGAIAVLRTAGMRRKAERLQSELRVYQDWQPTLGPVESYAPKAGTVLHLLTNSLPHTGSGYAQRSHSILQAQAALGWDVHAATRVGYPVQIGKLFARDQDDVEDVTYHRLLTARLPGGFDERLQLQAELLLKLALEVRPAVLHTTTHFINGLVVREVARVLGIPWVYEVRGQLADTWASVRGADARHSEKYLQFQKREKEVMLDAGLVVTLGHAMKANILAVGVPESKVLLMPNAVGGDFLDEPLTQVDARREVGLSASGQYIGTVSSLVPYEGIQYLIQAFGLLATDHPDLRLLIVGDGVSMPSLRAQAEQSAYKDRIIFTGRVPRRLAVRYHQALDVFAVPREDLEVTRDVTPLKPVEALACARPVVAADLPALREIVEPGVTGILTKSGSANALADGLGILLANPALAARLGRAGRARVLNERTWAANAAALASELEKLGVTDG
ncbi:glycosyltransferase family 4 protein [Arthrobacter sp. MDT1-48-3]